MVLWKKESNSDDAPFVDLFVGVGEHYWAREWKRKLKSSEWKNEKELLFTKVDPGKNNQKSDHLRAKGNAVFGIENWITAMQLYSLSLCFAEPETNNVSFAYANRAACFLNLERYDECLRDIEMAVQAKYPNMPKLMQRKAKCEGLMENASRRTKNDIKLSFNPNEQFPCMADALEIQKNYEYGRHVIAKHDIDVGQTVLVEKCLISLGCAPDRVQCYSCGAEDSNFIPCPKCTDVMFCSEECRLQNDVHERFCGATINRMSHDVRYLAESIMIGMVSFATGNEMMNFVNDKLANRDTEIPAAANDLLSQYGLFLSLKPRVAELLDIELMYKVYTALLDIPLVSAMFNTQNARRFFMHLIGEHWSIIRNNSFKLRVPGVIMVQILGVITSLFNHSCAPNLFNMSTNGTEYFIALRPIKKGEQAFIKYAINTGLSGWDFTCKCDKCEPRCKKSDRLMMVSDPDYTFLKQFNPSDLTKRSQLDVKSKCTNFLRKYGHLPWTVEMNHVLELYTDILADFVKHVK